MAGELDAYADARKAFETARATLMTFANRIVEVGRALQKHPPDFGFSNLGPGHAMSARISQTMDAKDWPTAPQLMEAINRFYAAHSAMNTAYSNIPMDRRGMVEHPDSPSQSSGTMRPMNF